MALTKQNAPMCSEIETVYTNVGKKIMYGDIQCHMTTILNIFTSLRWFAFLLMPNHDIYRP